MKSELKSLLISEITKISFLGAFFVITALTRRRLMLADFVLRLLRSVLSADCAVNLSGFTLLILLSLLVKVLPTFANHG